MSRSLRRSDFEHGLKKEFSRCGLKALQFPYSPQGPLTLIESWEENCPSWSSGFVYANGSLRVTDYPIGAPLYLPLEGLRSSCPGHRNLIIRRKCLEGGWHDLAVLSFPPPFRSTDQCLAEEPRISPDFPLIHSFFLGDQLRLSHQLRFFQGATRRRCPLVFPPSRFFSFPWLFFMRIHQREHHFCDDRRDFFIPSGHLGYCLQSCVFAGATHRSHFLFFFFCVFFPPLSAESFF